MKITNALWLAFSLTLFLTADLSAQSAENLLKGLTPETQTIAGQWTIRSGELKVEASKAARYELAESVKDNYSLTVEFTRISGDNTVGVILPIGEVSPALELSAWQGIAHGLSRVNGLAVKDPANPTASTPGSLENRTRYRLKVVVTATEDSASVSATLNETILFNWKGLASQLQPNVVMNLPSSGAIGLIAQNSEVVFHKVTLERGANTVTPTTPKPTAPVPKSNKANALGRMELSTLSQPETPGWEPFNGARFNSISDKGNSVLSSLSGSGAGDRGAYLKEATFSEGIIELDLKGTKEPQSSFVGVVFHGIDGNTYESIYFRPFNFGNSDEVRRGHAVQYISHPEWPWQKLRQERPEEFENPVSPEPKPEDWFRARIEVSEKDVKVFIDDGKTPSLVVEKLSSISDGKVGLWFNGNASFKNLKITPR